jgi:hypothetical protein
VSLLAFAVSGLAAPLGVPPASEDPAMSAAAPPQCLAYVSWSGMAAADPKSTSRTEQLVAEPEVQKSFLAIVQVVKSAIRAQAEKERPGGGEAAAGLFDLGMELLAKPAAAFLSKIEPPSANGPPTESGGAIINLGDDAEKLWATIVKYQKDLGLPAQDTKTGDATFFMLQPAPDAPELTWGLHGKHLVIGIGRGEAKGILERMSGQPPKWLAAVRKRLPVERQALFTFVNVRAIVGQVSEQGGEKAAAVIEALGLGNVTALATAGGLDGDGYASKSLLGVQGEPSGILSILKQAPLTAEDLAPLPKDAIMAGALRLDLDLAWEKGLEIAAAVDPEAAKKFRGGLAMVEAQLGFKIRDDLLKPLGDVWCFSTAPPQGPVPLPRVLIVVKLRDSKRFAATHEKLVAMAGAALANMPPGRGPAGQIKRGQLGGRDLFSLQLAQPGVPVAPSWCITDKELVVALSPQVIQGYLAQGSGSGSLADVPEVAALLKGDVAPFALVYQNTPELVRNAYPALQMGLMAAAGPLKQQGIEINPALLPSPDAIVKHLRPSLMSVGWSKVGLQTSSSQTVPGETIMNPASGGIMVALLLPAVQAAREAARRAQSTNNLKQIGLALHNYHDQKKSFPPAYTTDKAGKPGLSWRVLILPYVEQTALYQQFHLDEPWDSEHNKPLAAKIPPVYVSPNYSGPAGRTNYLGIGGEQGVFGGKEGVPMAKITDGLSNTIMAVEANNQSAVEWTRPDVFVPDAANPTKGLTGLRPGGFNALFADASVRFISEKIDLQTLKALFTCNGGEAAESFQRSPGR